MNQHATEVAARQRFEFGKNWAWFLETLNDEKIDEAVNRCAACWRPTALQARAF
jgi:hypothetical protein